MKLIHKFKSSNFDERKSKKIYFIIIHYTSLESISESIEYLCSSKNKVSCHYLISKSGQIYNLVSEKKRAWHAGQSFWSHNIDINSKSIGIELDYVPSFKNKKFSKDVISSLMVLLDCLIKKHKIRLENILGHSDIAPYRKIDPGRNFPWHLLEEKKLSYRIREIKKTIHISLIVNKWFKRNKFFSKKKLILFMLDFIGYDISLAMKSKSHFNQLILNYSNRYRYYKNYTYNKRKIINVVELHFFNKLLTKVKKQLKK